MPLEPPVQGSHLPGPDGQGNFPALSRLQRHPGKCRQRHHRLDRAAHQIPQIHLGHGVPCPFAGVGNPEGNRHRFSRPDAVRGQGKPVVGEAGIAQPVSEGPQRRPVRLHIPLSAPRPPAVVAGDLSDGSREADGQPAGGIVLPEQGFRDGDSALLPREPCFQDGRNMQPLPFRGHRPSRLQHQHHRRSRPADRLQEGLLVARQIQARPVQVFAAGVGVISREHDGHVRLPGQLHRPAEVLPFPDPSKGEPGRLHIVHELDAQPIAPSLLKPEGHGTVRAFAPSPPVQYQLSVHI